MASQGSAPTLVYYAYNTSTGAYVTGDVANHTLKLVKDGTEASPTNAASEVDSTNMPGAYKLLLTTSETAFNSVTLGGKSSTANVIIIPITMSFELLPTASPGASNGVLISGSNSGTTTLGALTVTGSTTMSDGLLISRSSSNTSAITATGNGTGSGAVFTSGSGATGDGIQATAASTNGNGMKLTKAGSGSDLNATTTPLTLAKTTNITGFNDIAATAVVSSGAITTSGGAVSTVTAVTNPVGITSNRKKGSTATFEFLMQDATTGAPKTGLTVAAAISKDGGAAASTSNSVTEIGLGQYQLVLTATEMTANNIFLQMTATGAVTTNLSIQTQP